MYRITQLRYWRDVGYQFAVVRGKCLMINHHMLCEIYALWLGLAILPGACYVGDQHTSIIVE